MRRATPGGVQIAVDGYVRVSRVGKRRGERFISPAVQRDHIETCAVRNNLRLLEVMEELDESGGRADRPLLELAIARIEHGLSRGLVVAKLDRFSRSLIDGLVILDRVRAAGGHFYSAMDGLDVDTDSGRLMARILLSKDEWELERFAAAWREARARAIARGVFTGSTPPVGYRRSRSGRLRPDPSSAAAITEVFERRAAGESTASLGQFLEARGIRTAFGNPGWTGDSVGRILGNPTYLGEVRCGALRRARAHPPLVDPATWERAQRPRPIPRPRSAASSTLVGLVRCGSCGRRMDASRQPRRDGTFEPQFACRRYYAAGACPRPEYICATPLEAYVEDVVLELLRRRRRAPEAQITAAVGRLAAAETALARYRESERVMAALGEQAFADGLAVRAERVRAARLDVADARSRQVVHDLPPSAELYTRWLDMAVPERRAIVRATIDCVFVGPVGDRAADRVTVCPAGTAPRGLSESWDWSTPLRSVRSRRGWVNPGDATARRAATWSPARVERELRRFTKGRTDFPAREEFRDAGRAQLQRQIIELGGEAVWAHRLGLDCAGRETAVPWTDARIRAGLTLYLQGTSVFPPQKQFRDDGLGGLRQAVARHGGVRAWARELGVEYRVRYAGPGERYWTDDRIRSDLIDFCAGRTTFPSQREFSHAGKAALYEAIYIYHGRSWWANEISLRVIGGKPRQRPPRV